MPTFARVRRCLALLSLACLAWLGGCAAPKVAPPKVPPPVAPAPGAAAAAPVAPAATASSAAAAGWNERLESAASRLRSAIGGNGVEVSQTTDQRLWVSLPAEASFAPGRPALTPAAGAWLDQISNSLRTMPRAQVQIVGPLDPRGSSALALDRAASARDWLVMRGVPAARMAVSGAAPKGRDPVPGRLDILVGER